MASARQHPLARGERRAPFTGSRSEAGLLASAGEGTSDALCLCSHPAGRPALLRLCEPTRALMYSAGAFHATVAAIQGGHRVPGGRRAARGAQCLFTAISDTTFGEVTKAHCQAEETCTECRCSFFRGRETYLGRERHSSTLPGLAALV
ncbi:hypothetical protein NDU88_003098 [Pleurodeles waltl]|uniref:Uncharacterized protein n=1 Tax=Pleurodeles waltl TaxID=8319 RepID=A0AAV7WTQ4_PLEWA|nr:hypothetical protein NDU88_003098 [Pleurodeles waltl]